MGDMIPLPTKGEYEVMKREHEVAENRRFFDREATLMRDMKNKIGESNKQRWG
jgi:hypothetical protein